MLTEEQEEQRLIERANNPEAKKLRQGMYDDLNIMAFDFIALLKACKYSKDEAIEIFSNIWDRVLKPDDADGSTHSQ